MKSKQAPWLIFIKKAIPILSIAFFFVPEISVAQSGVENLTLPANGEITLKEVATDTVYFIPIKVNKLPSSGTQAITISDANLRTSTADKGKDYDYLTQSSISLTASSSDYFSLGIKVYSRKIKSDIRTFIIDFAYQENSTNIIQHLKVKIEPLVPIVDKKELPDTSKWKVRIITGSNFDFFDAPTFKNFAGDLNIFLPDLIQFPRSDERKKKHPKQKDVSLGVQLGIFNYRYFESDSSKGRIQSDRYLLDPTVTSPVVGATRYVNETYALNNKTSYNTLGAYLNPIFTVYSKKWVDLYFNLHFEGLWRTQMLEDVKVPIRKDTVTIGQNDINQGIVLQSYPGLRPTYTKRSFNDLYIGIGLPFRIDIKKAFELFVTPTFGWADYEDNRITTREQSSIRYRTYVRSKFKDFFMLTKAQLVTTVSPIDIAIGGEFRKLGNQQTFYAIYLGAALSLDKLKK